MGTNTGLGIGIGIPFKNNALGGDKLYFPPELKARMIGVWTSYGKKNTDADRNIIKNKIPNAGGDLEILNAAYKLNSGFGKYSEDFTTWTKSSKITSVDSESFDFVTNVNWNLLYYKSNIGKDIPSFKVHIKLKGEGKVFYNYITSEGVFTNKVITSEEYVVPISYNTKYTGETPVNCGFSIGITSEECSGTITQIPNFEDAFVTDGINDMIISQKTIAEMSITDEVTIVSMIHQISLNPTYNNGFTNYIENLDKSTYVRNNIYKAGKTGIYGYSASLTSRTYSNINNILGDKKDYGTEIVNRQNTLDASKLSIIGRATGFTELSSVAYYWTFAVLGKATEDEINLIIAKYNLDRTLRPDILCNIAKQGITNDNHADFNDKLIDYSGNGRDIQMNNLAWKGGSGIAAKKFETIKDYSIIPDEGLQELTIYNEFSFKIKSIRYANRYWAVQSLNKTDMSYPVTIITDKDIIWRNTLNYTDADGVKGSVKKETNVPANTPTQVFIYGFNDFDISDDYTKVNCVAYATRKDITEFTVTFIPSYKGGLLLDGVDDYGKVTGMPVYKDYTVVTDREIFANIGAISSKNNPGAFVETVGNSVHSFGQATSGLNFISTRSISYLSKYSYCGQSITAGAAEDGTDMWLGTIRDNDSRFFNGAIYSLMTFPYSMSKFLIERQLKKHKLGTLYPDMVEFRPIIKANDNYKIFYTAMLPLTGDIWERINIGDYVPVGRRVAIQLSFDNEASELVSAISSQLGNISITKNSNNKGYTIFGDILKNKSPQKINITIDEYIRYEDIVQPYPVLLRFKDENGNEVSWGGKFKVGSTITRIGSATDSNLLPNIYNIFGLLLNGNQVTSSKVIVEKTMVFKAKSAYIFDNNEPKCILSPSRLRIPNSSYKILGYIPDISGHGNNGVIHNSAYAEGSGVNEDGSYQLDGVDDFVTIPTLSSGGKQVLMKVNWNTIDSIIYDQRGSGGFAIYCSDYHTEGDSITIPAYKGRNAAGTTYIDGIRNEYVIASQLRNVTHNIVEILDTSYAAGNINPIIGKSNVITKYGSLALYDFMLFDNISTDDKIKELNEYVGIEAKVELPPYYWDAYGKTNLDGDKATIQQRGVAVGDYDITNYNHAYDKMSGYGGYNLGRFDKSWASSSSSNTSIKVVQRNPYDITLKKLGGNSDWEFNNTELKVISNPVSVKFKSNKNIRVMCDYHYYPVGGNSEGTPLGITSKDLIANKDAIITISPISQENIDKYNIDVNRGYYLIYFQLSSTLAVNEEVIIEMLPLYPNGLVYDGITDYSKNANIPALDDFTAIIKREWLKKQGCPLIKGSKVYEGGNGNALLLEWDKAYNFVFYKRTDIMEGELPDNISFITPTNYNGNVITRGSEQDTNGICIAGDGNTGFANMVFYKLILYPKTIPLLQINFLKNLMERDEIIDLDNPIFKK